MYTIKLYQHIFSSTPYAQLEEIDDIEIEQNLNDLSTLSFFIPLYKDMEGNLNFYGIQDKHRVVLLKQGRGEKIIFDGYIYSLENTESGVKVEVRDFKSFLTEDKILFADITYTSQTLSYILNDLVVLLNTRTSSDTFIENWTYSVDTDVTVTGAKTYKKKDNIYNVLLDLANTTGKKFKIEDGKIIFKTILGTDKTIAGDEYTELEYNYKDSRNNNIENIGSKTFSSIKNVFYDGSTTNTESTSINTYGRYEGEYSTMPTTNERVDLSQTQRVYSFSPITSKIDTEVEIGDKVVVTIDAINTLLNYSGSQFISKVVKVVKGGKLETYKVEVGEFIAKKTDFYTKINYLQDTVKKLQL